jgi:hypothetical protein
MRDTQQWMVVVLIIAGLQLSACEQASSTHLTEHPARVEHIDGTELSRVTLTEKAIQRLDLKTDQVREAKLDGLASKRRVVPYSSLIYDPNGQTWVYTSPEPRTFVRQQVEVDFIKGDLAVLKKGPPTGTVLASVGVAELYGAEFEVGH